MVGRLNHAASRIMAANGVGVGMGLPVDKRIISDKPPQIERVAQILVHSDLVNSLLLADSDERRNDFRGLMWKEELELSFVDFMKDGAQWLVDNTDIKLVGIDYLSVAAFDDIISAHIVYLERRSLLLV
ncbi:cyclase-like protein 4 [Apium graveolens]|uniref:cyclase-like protein 4 n=1 Tax=Apium graveolens TaxID=4045 RepID=UPI003D79C6BD